MANLTNQANGVKAKTKNSITQELVNINQKMNSLFLQTPPKKHEIKRLGAIQRELINNLQIIAITSLKNLNNSQSTKTLVKELNKQADAAKKEANKLKNLAEKLQAFETMLSNITRLVIGITRLVA